MNGAHPETSWKTTKWRDEAVKLTIYSVSSPCVRCTTRRSKGIREFDRCAAVERKRRFMAQGSRFLLSVPSGWDDWRIDHPSRSRRHRDVASPWFQTIRSLLSFSSNPPLFSIPRFPVVDLLNSIIKSNATPLRLNSVDNDWSLLGTRCSIN